MQTRLADFIRDTAEGREADEILRKCVHCGFCTATCPTYQLLGDELDGPRGRIYLIKQVLEGDLAGAATQRHLDRCLSCGSCETTCPSGVRYLRLAEIGRQVIDTQVERPAGQRAARWLLRELVSRPAVFGAAVSAGRAVRGLLPQALRDKVPPLRAAGNWPAPRHSRRVLALAGCVQPSMAPAINAAAARVLDRLGISMLEQPGAGCCGAVRLHLSDAEGARADARRNIDAWWPAIEGGETEAILMTASACALQVRDYGHLLQADAAYAEKARVVAGLARDVAEVLGAEAARLQALLATREQGDEAAAPALIAWHSPCTLQHGLRLRGTVEALLEAAGFRLAPVANAHLCCGSAGTYSILQPALSLRLRADKLKALQAQQPALIASANIGCITHLQAGTATPVRHWIELIDERLDRRLPKGSQV